jgi:hypothetical protein
VSYRVEPRAAAGWRPSRRAGGVRDNGRGMARRRILLFVVFLLLIAAVADSMAPRDAREAVKPPPTATTPPPPASVSEATLPEDGRVRARVGDIVRLEVNHGDRDEVQILALGISEPVERGLPAEIVFDADRPGRFAVTLRDAGRRIGTVEIRPAE